MPPAPAPARPLRHHDHIHHDHIQHFTLCHIAGVMCDDPKPIIQYFTILNEIWVFTLVTIFLSRSLLDVNCCGRVQYGLVVTTHNHCSNCNGLVWRDVLGRGGPA